ncbi:SDR family oxidoreductase (plasmid) [Rhodococcus erythropolis]|uniref:SDR family NAD(P)-dependent oxidoreductase n=1 Tax=Rhodococcus TaxID=1827 RepID=UPI0012463028|nr:MULTISPECIES: SDR family oxidoreductase [Rhodococcus]MCJ0950624.1 SDR family oxidoreductase [Rhodococcus sp. ARC_M8]MDJ0441705.1 SDR family oxidoreductase [Rhodococcus qingshengii]QEX08385.1 SDR family oxidoreductase [Rhodococcus erythropolis]
MDLLIRNKSYLVVGGTAGMGLAAARALAADGASVVVVGRDGGRAEKAAAEVLGAGASRAFGLSCDVSATGEAERAVAESVALLGRLDGVAVTTGILGKEPIEAPDENWIAAFHDVLLGTTRTVESALPHLITTRGTIVTTAAYSVRAPEIARLPYASLKGAVSVFTKGIAKAYGRHGIRANCVCPGAIETDALRAIRAHVAQERGYPYEEALERVMVEEWGLNAALGRPGQPDEVGELIAFLLSPRAGYLTGALVNIDGGTDF